MRGLLLSATILAAGCSTAQAQVRVGVGGDVTVTEGGPAVVPIVKSGRGRASFNYVTVGQTALDGRDFQGVSGSLSPYGSTSVTIQTLGNDAVDGTRTFLLRLTGKGKTTVTDPEAVITILDDDTAPVTPLPVPTTTEPVPTTDPAPTPEPTPTGDIMAVDLNGLADIPSEFDPNLGMITLSQTAQDSVKSAAPDVVGAFRFTCGFSGLGYMDPIVYPGDRTGKSHLHQFYGNTAVNPDSDYHSLRSSGKSTCNYGLYTLNRSAYWQAALLDGKGNALQADNATIYYKRRPSSDPKCSLDSGDPAAEGNCVPLPNGIRFIFGFDMVTNTLPTGSFDMICSKDGTSSKPFYKFADAALYSQCTAGGKFYSRGKAPGCWDGKRVDSANHRDHVAYAAYYNGVYKCPPDHPYVFPGFTLISAWRILEGDTPWTWSWASDAMRPDLPAGSTMHADFFGAHDPVARQTWNINPDSCINGMLNCSSGIMSKTKMLPGANQPKYPDATGKLVSSWENPKRVVPLDSIPTDGALVGETY